ncbi:Rne/Rng family ribonuclease [Paenibacillus lycopersici]|uniref:Rne/Rng family ribonuclease n=1 Tax=Paenibacillus lycopersici TaxID=2704462 RepID=A0A6C0FY74_9BACL|nr:Rne/Rng family ribonuclease [Paenibacillus lycopersici]QHT62058.1 Rne/Rng family ribonuclease [Paenibacillus lycopersici]
MKKMLVHGQKDMLQIAIVSDNALYEYYMEKTENAGQLVGSIIKARVINVLPGMQAAFVDIGLPKNAFLYIDDVLHPHLERQPKEKPLIAELLQPGQELLVQVMKEPLGGKGARVTTHFSLPGRFLVYMPIADYIGVSKKVSTEAERSRMRAVGDKIRLPGEGVIMRTAAEGESVESLQQDVQFLREHWQEIRHRGETASAPTLLHRDADLVHRLVRDLLTTEIDEIWIDDGSVFRRTKAMMKRLAPAMLPRLRLFVPQIGGASLFQQERIHEQLQEASQRRFRLKSGGDLVWDQTEALTVIDVNTGSFVGSSDLEDTVFRTNLEAAEQIARLLRLRDAGGIIIVDFIDMEEERHREQVMHLLERLARSDRTKCQVVGWTRLGLLEMTRKKVREQKMPPSKETSGGRD